MFSRGPPCVISNVIGERVSTELECGTHPPPPPPPPPTLQPRATLKSQRLDQNLYLQNITKYNNAVGETEREKEACKANIKRSLAHATLAMLTLIAIHTGIKYCEGFTKV